MSTTQADFKAACEKRGLTPSQELFSFWQDARKPDLAASGGNAAPIDPTVQGMADCMNMVQQELIEADAIPGGTAPMFIANEVVRKLNSYKRENIELKRVYEERGEQIKRLDIALERAASAPNAALVAALEALIEVAEQCDSWQSFPGNALAQARMALSAAGQEVSHG